MKLKPNLVFLLLVLIIGLSASIVAQAWINPSGNPSTVPGVLYYSGGNIGIGAAPTTYKLDVQGGQINSSVGLCIAGDCKTAWSQVVGGSTISAANVSANVFGANTGKGNYEFQHYNSTGDVMYIDATNDRVGIGTTSPQEKLTIGGSNVFAIIHTAAWDHIRMWQDGSTGYLDAGGSESGLAFRVDATAVSYPAPSYPEIMRLLPSGNVGIGTATPLGNAGDLTLGNSAGTDGKLYLYGSTAGVYSQIKTTNGNLHIDADTSHALYLNYYTGTAGIMFGNGATGSNASVSAAGTVTAAQFVGGGSGLTGVTVGLINGTYTGGGGLQPPSYIPSGKVRFNMMAGVPGTSRYQDWLMMDTYSGGDVPYVTMIGVSKTSGAPVGYLAVGAKGGSTWTSTPIITGSNIGSQSVANASNVTGGSLSGNLVATNYGIGNMGVYDSYRYQAVWSMGTSWLLPADGTTPGNLYGLAWTHSNVGGQSKAGLSHQLLVMENGVTKVALGSGIWTSYGGYFGGNVGIGTTDTGAFKLRVVGAFGAYNTSGTAVQGQGYIGVYGTGTWTGVQGQGTDAGSTGVFGSGILIGVQGQGGSYGVVGSGTTYGVYGNSSPIGVYGWGSTYDFSGPGNSYFGGTVTAAAFIYSSDISLKKNITTLDNSLEKILKLRGVSFNWEKNNQPGVGLIAQEVEKVFPELVTGEEGQKGVQYGNLVAPLIEAVKEQKKEIDQLEARIKILEERK